MKLLLQHMVWDWPLSWKVHRWKHRESCQWNNLMTERVFSLCASFFPCSSVLASSGGSKQSVKKNKDGKNNWRSTVNFVNQLILWGKAILLFYLLRVLRKCWKKNQNSYEQLIFKNNFFSFFRNNVAVSVYMGAWKRPLSPFECVYIYEQHAMI